MDGSVAGRGRTYCACEACTIKDMKTIPASKIPHNIRLQLSQILDPVRDLPDRDYRSFADRMCLTPNIVQWLDSQKVRGETSSICKILNYLSELHEDQFTVYIVFKILKDMDSEGQRVIMQGMPAIWRMHTYGCRPGMENTDPPSNTSSGSSPAQSCNSHPPPYGIGSQQLHLRMNDSENRYNYLENAEGQCHDVSFTGNCSGKSTGGGAVFLNNNHRNQDPCEDSFHANDNHLEYEDGYPDSQFSDPPPSYWQSQQQHSPSPTALHDLKLPLFISPDQPEPSSPIKDPSRNARVGQQDQSCWDSMGQDKSQSRPASYPSQRPSKSYQPRPISEGSYCSHLGAYNCIGAPTPSSSVIQSTGRSIHNVSQVPESSLSFNGAPWQGSYHDTEVKKPVQEDLQPILKNGHHNSLPYGKKYCESNYSRFISPNERSINQRQKPTSDQTSQFVFILAADAQESKQLEHHLETFCQQLQKQNISYVVVTSTTEWPQVHLSPVIKETFPQLNSDVRSVKPFVKSCLRKATKILIMISPGYLCYADEYWEDATTASCRQQKLIRHLHELLKYEYFNERSRKLRIWPVILTAMKTNRAHIPSFLSEVFFYCYPNIKGEDVVAVIKSTLKR